MSAVAGGVAAGTAVASVPAAAPVVDFDLRGLAQVRLLGAGAAELAAVARQLGPTRAPAPLAAAPDITLRFVDRLEAGDDLRLIGVDEAGFDEKGFYLLRGRQKAAVKVAMPFEALGEPCEVLCERGLPAVPLLIAAINLRLLARGILPLHATAFEFGGRGVLAAGWAKGGKTELLLGFARQGARYIGDEWVYIEPESGRMRGLPEPIRIWDWHLDELPDIRARLPRGDRVKLGVLGAGARGLNGLAAGRVGRTALGRATRRSLPLLQRQRWVQAPPEALFGAGGCAAEGRIDRVILVGSHAAPGLRAEPIAGEAVARRMLASLQFEQLPLLEHYLRFRFAFPERRNPLIEDLEARQRTLLDRALAGRPAWALWHPYPAPIPALFEAARPLVED